jgi:glycosyltransferase involved in cell wall biosynthesis
MTSKSILFISKGIDSSATRYRALQFFSLLKFHGFTPDHVTASGGFLAILRTLWQASQADVVVVLRKTFPAAITWLLRRVSKRLIFDLDDAIFCRSNGLHSKTRMKRFANIAKVSDHVFAGNQFLAENSFKFNDAVTVIPTCLDVAKYEVAVDKPDDYIDLVWIGSKSTSKYLRDILPSLEMASQNLSNLRLKIIADFDLPSAIMPVLAIPWSEVGEAKELASSHIGIAPMIDNDWTRGKCALKILQYMAASLPVVSSNVGVNGEAVVADETGYLVSSPEQWIAAINGLATNKKNVTEMGVAGHNRVKQHYDINVVFQQILTVLEQ